MDSVDRYSFKNGGGHVKCPTLVIHGKKDPVIQLYHPEFIAKNISHCVVHMFDEGGHSINRDGNFIDDFNHLTENFIVTNA